jgi:formylglycine-generating enzyme required for sulfatase activity
MESNRRTKPENGRKQAAAMVLTVFSGVLAACVGVAAYPGLDAGQAEQQSEATPSRAGEVKVNSKDGMKYVWIPPGTFMMGCSPGDRECRRSEKPSHQVTITRGFWMGQTEVTVAAYQRFASSANQQMPPAPVFNSGWVYQNMPITNVNWREALAYCTWTGGRLPTEAEWEYAARGGDARGRYGDLDQIAWYGMNSGSGTHDVAQKQPNGFGLYDTLGNVWEWVNDWFDDHYYQHTPSQDPTGPESGEYRVLRGGSWFYFPRFVRVSIRVALDPDGRIGNYGIRCVGRGNLP